MADCAAERDFLGAVRIGGERRMFLIAGPCVLESRELALTVADQLGAIAERLKIPLIFKSSYDKANRTSADSRRGPGPEEGLRILAEVKQELGLPVLTDVHETAQVPAAADVVDVLQIPAFLSRQTDLIAACARTGLWVNVKKGQFMAPGDCSYLAGKMHEAGSDRLLITERGTSFGYNNLVFDPRSLDIIHDANIPVVFDATHSAQLPGTGKESGGQRRFVPVLARAAVAAGVEGLFMEIHPTPEQAWSDSAVQFPLDQAERLLSYLVDLDSFVKERRGA